jgi:hypothetical protein
MGLAGKWITRIEAGAVTPNAALISQGLQKGLTESDATVFYGVVSIDVEIPGTPQVQIANRVFGERAKHVVEEPDSGLHFGPALAINVELHPDGGLAGLPLNLGAPLGHAGQAVTADGVRNKVFV